MSPLRERVRRRPAIGVAMLFAFMSAAALLDTARSPADQVTARLYIGMVRMYQAWGSPLLREHIRCRYRPSCSEYSIQAVEHFGLWQGLGLTVSRLARCTTRVPLGTCDPVPTGIGKCDEAGGFCQTADTPTGPHPREEEP